MGFLEVADLAEAASFKARVKVGLVAAAGAILSTPKDDDMTSKEYDKRVELANNVLRDPGAMVPAFIWPILSNTTIANSGLDSTDGDLLFQIAAVWSNLAGVTAADKQP